MMYLGHCVKNMAMKYTIKYLPGFSRDLSKITYALEKYPAKAKRLIKEMFYMVDEQAREVKVCHILYGKLDILRYLKD